MVLEQQREAVDSEIGRTLLGKWKLLRLVGVGGMGAVYEAQHRNGRRCAIKLLHKRFSDDPNITERFLREGSVANLVDHPNVVAIEDEDRDERGRAFLVMEFLKGESLDTWLDRAGGKLDHRVVEGLMVQLLEVLEKAHAAQVIHRDIKPANLFVADSGQLKVLDFGVAQASQIVRESTLTTKGGDVLGTPAYMPPEQALGLWEQVDARTDIWAVGATMFTLISGQPVHTGRTPNEQLARAMTVSARSLSKVAPNVPLELCKVVDKALAFEQKDRYQSVTEMLDALHPGPRGARPTDSQVWQRTAPPTTVRRGSGRRAWPLVVFFLVLPLLGLLLWLRSNGGDRPVPPTVENQPVQKETLPRAAASLPQKRPDDAVPISAEVDVAAPPATQPQAQEVRAVPKRKGSTSKEPRATTLSPQAVGSAKREAPQVDPLDVRD